MNKILFITMFLTLVSCKSKENVITEQKVVEICNQQIAIYQKNTDEFNKVMKSLDDSQKEIEKSRQTSAYNFCISEANEEYNSWRKLNCKEKKDTWVCYGFSAQSAPKEMDRRDRKIEHCLEKFPLAEKN